MNLTFQYLLNKHDTTYNPENSIISSPPVSLVDVDVSDVGLNELIERSQHS